MLENEWGEVYALLIHRPLHDLINYILVWREMKPHNQKKSNLAVSWWHSNENKHIIHSGQYCVNAITVTGQEQTEKTVRTKLRSTLGPLTHLFWSFQQDHTGLLQQIQFARLVTAHVQTVMITSMIFKLNYRWSESYRVWTTDCL